MIALLVEDMLVAQGFSILGLFTRNAQALAFLMDHRPDLAIIDFSLADGNAYPLADKLRERRVPFFIISGFTRSAANSTLDGTIWLEKPFSEEQFLSCLSTCFRNASGSSACA